MRALEPNVKTGFAVAAAFLGLTIAGVVAQSPPGANVSDRFYSAIRRGDVAAVKALADGGASVNTKDARGITPLMNAAAVGSLETMRLLIEKGADVNVRNNAGSTALMWSATEIAKIKLLIDHGADVNIVSNHGRSVLLLAAMSDHSADIVKLLWAAHANPRVVDDTKTTALISAAYGNDAETLRLLVDAGLGVNDADAGGFTPLMNAAGQGNLEAVKLLLAKGANVNAVTAAGGPPLQVKNGTIALGHDTALVLAAPFASPEVIDALIRAGADVNAREVRGMTPLMLAIATDRANPKTIQTLVAAGADVNAKSGADESPLEWAQKSGATPVAELLKRAGATARPLAAHAVPAPAPVGMKPAVERSVALLERSARTFFVNGACAACHAQNVTDIALASARAAGIPVSTADATLRQTATASRYSANVPALLERFDGQGPPDVALYSLAGLASAGYAPDRTTDALVANLTAQQSSRGNWSAVLGVARPPIEDGDFFRTALGIRALAVYGPPGRGPELKQRIQNAVAWLQATPALTAEDRNTRLLGLRWGGADQSLLQQAARGILAKQRPDGGWAQRDELASDAYATGQTLYTLMETAQVKGSDDPVKRGAQFLLSTQRGDGSWYVRSRSPKFQPYFEGGFPYGHDQWISSMGTGWATAALSATLKDSAAAPRVH
jgi:ankyrin repeat protein